MEALEKLVSEHKLILSYLELIEKIITKYSETGNLEILFEQGDKVIKFIQEYADEHHHAKEENILFKILGKPGVLTHCNPIGQMLLEHDMGREFVQKMKQSLEDRDNEKFVSSSLGYCQLLRDHISKENNILYPMAEDSLSPDLKEEINVRFIEKESETCGKKLDVLYSDVFGEIEAWFSTL